MSYYSESELQSLGFKSVGENVKLSRKASIYNAQNISIGNHVRIDDFCVLSTGDGGIILGSYIHIAPFSLIIGRGKVELADFSGLSSRVSVYSSNDHYLGKWMTNPTVPEQYTNVTHADVNIEKHVIIGSGTIVLPGVTLEEGVAIGALSLVKSNCKSFSIFAGNPAKLVGKRSKKLLDHEREMLRVINSEELC